MRPAVAPDVLNHQSGFPPALIQEPLRSMNRDFQIRFTAGLLILLTTAAVVLAWINFQKEADFQIPSDGVWWMEQTGSDGGVVAKRVEPNGPGDKAGIRVGDRLTAINQHDVKDTTARMRQVYRVGAWSKATYSLVRQSVPLDTTVILIPAERSLNYWLRFIALIYLGIGLYVLLRRWTAPSSTHFYIFCLVSFIFYAFKFTGKLNQFDWTIYWGNVTAWLLQPALFLHFVLTFPEKRNFVRKHRWIIPAIYVPGMLLLGVHILALRVLKASERLRWNLDRVQMGYLALFFVIAAAVLWDSYRRASTPILRQQLKWVTRGTILAIAPFTLFYVIPYLTGSMPSSAMKVSVLSLGLLPLTFGYAIFRYRLMDVDLIFKRGMVYTLAAAAIVGVYFAVVAGVAELVHTQVPSSGPVGLVLAMVVTALLFDPVRKWIQERIDQFFYRTRYDYRKTLIEFGRELSAETDLDRMLSSVVDRLSRTLLVDRMAIFLSAGEPPQFLLAKSFGMTQTGGLDLNFLSAPRPETEAGHLFLENVHQVPRETASAQQTIARLDLNYYIPCRAQQRTIAFLGLGKTVEGDFLTSEDVELLETLAGYIGIAIQNARLYASLEQKVAEYERLKDFNENIVESINVGVMAVDLADRIESWNSQMEVMYALPRWQALTRPLSEVFPAEFVEEFYRVRQNPGHQQPVQVPPGDAHRREPHGERCHRAPGHPEVQRDRAADHRGRHHRTHRPGIATLAGRQAFLDWPAGGRGGARSQHSAGRDFLLRPDAVEAAAGRSAKGRAARENHAADLPGLGDCEQPAEFLAHQRHGIHGSERQQDHRRHHGAAGAPVQDHQDQGGGRTGRPSAADQRQSGTPAASLPESVPERARRHARRRNAAGGHLERRRGQRGRVRHRHRHRAGAHPAHLRSVLHHQGGAA